MSIKPNFGLTVICIDFNDNNMVAHIDVCMESISTVKQMTCASLLHDIEVWSTFKVHKQGKQQFRTYTFHTTIMHVDIVSANMSNHCFLVGSQNIPSSNC